MADEVAKPAPPAAGETWQQQVTGGENPDDLIAVVSPSGKGGTIARKNLDEALTNGFRLEHPTESYERSLDKAYGDAPVQTFLESAASTASLGLTDSLGGEGLRERRKRNEGANILGSVAGAVLPIGAGGLATGLGRAAGELTTEAIGGGFLGRVAGAGARGVTEGGVFGLGQGISEIGLSDKPVDLEHAVTTIGSNVLYGGLLGGGFGVGGKLLEEGALAAKNAAAAHMAKWAKPEVTLDRGQFPEIASMDSKEVREAIEARKHENLLDRSKVLEEGKKAYAEEEAALNKARDAEAEALHAKAVEFKDWIRTPETFVVSSDKEISKQLSGAKFKIMRALDTPKSFVTYRGSRMLEQGLEAQEIALSKVAARSEELMARASEERNLLYDHLPESNYLKDVYMSPEQSALYREWKGIEPLKKTEAMAISGEALDEFKDAIGRGDWVPPSQRRLDLANKMLERNNEIQQELKNLKSKVTSPKLMQIDNDMQQALAGLKDDPKLNALKAHKEDLSDTPFGKKVAQHLGSATLGGAGFKFGGPVGGALGWATGREIGGSLYDKILGRMNVGAKFRTKAMAGYVDKFFDSSAKGLEKATPLASRVLPSIKYAPKDYVDGVLGHQAAKESKDAVINSFRERARELNAMTQKQPDGSYSVRMNARDALGQRLQAFWAVNPTWGNGIEALANRRLEFLAEKLPRNPGAPHLQIGPDEWEPSKADVAKFARYMEAVEFPERIVQRLAATTMTPEDAEVLKKVYPGMYQDVRTQVMQKAAELQTKLPYAKRLALSIFMDVPVDPAITSESISVYQNLYNPELNAMAENKPEAKPAPTKPFINSQKPTAAERMSGE